MLHFVFEAILAATLAATAATPNVHPTFSAAKVSTAIPNASMTHRSATTTAGKASHGFALSLTADATHLQLGSPVWVTLEIRNASGKTQYASFGDRHGSYVFTVVNKTTNRVAERDPESIFGQDFLSGPVRGRPVPEHYSKYLHFQVDALYKVKGPGVYRIQCTAAYIAVDGHPVTLPPSNTIIIYLN